MPDDTNKEITEEAKFTARADSQVQEKPPTRTRSKKVDVDDVPANLPKLHHLFFDQLHRLATMPREKKRDFVQAAFWSTVATSVSGFAALSDILAKVPVQPKLLDLSQMVIFVISLTALVLGLLGPKPPQTSEEYLKEICRIDPDPPRGMKAKILHLVNKYFPG